MQAQLKRSSLDNKIISSGDLFFLILTFDTIKNKEIRETFYNRK